jgi:hypothetical protein
VNSPAFSSVDKEGSGGICEDAGDAVDTSSGLALALDVVAGGVTA